VKSLILTLLGFGAGVAVGLAWRDAPEPVRRPVRTTATELAAAERESEAELEPGSESEVESRAESRSEEAIALVEYERAGVGTLEFDGRVDGDMREAWIEYRTVNGESGTLEGRRGEDELQRWRLRSGAYSLCWWHGVRDDRRVIDVRIRPGEVTRVSATTAVAPEQFPIEPGLGRIEVTVFDLEDRRAPQANVEFEYVDVRGEIDAHEENAASDGSLRVDLLPGDYVVRVGCQEQRARLRAGETLPITFRSRSEGEVRFVGGKRCHLVPVVESKTRMQSFARLADDTGHRYIYMRPGLYEARLAFPGDVKSRVLGRVEVSAGVITEFTTDPLPTAHLRISVKRPQGSHVGAARFELTPLDAGAQPSGWKLRQSFTVDWAHVTARHLSPGLWRLKVHAIHCDLLTRTIEVGHEKQKVKVELQRSAVR
jgi:hypothetical protein